MDLSTSDVEIENNSKSIYYILRSVSTRKLDTLLFFNHINALLSIYFILMPFLIFSLHFKYQMPWFKAAGAEKLAPIIIRFFFFKFSPLISQYFCSHDIDILYLYVFWSFVKHFSLVVFLLWVLGRARPFNWRLKSVLL